MTESGVVPPGSCEGSGSLSSLVDVSGGGVISYIPQGSWQWRRAGNRRGQCRGNQHHRHRDLDRHGRHQLMRIELRYRADGLHGQQQRCVSC